MIGLVLVTHGRLADEFRAALEHVMGPQQQIEAVTIGAGDNVDLCRRDIIEAINRVDNGDGVAILTDMFGGTPSNLAISCMSRPKVDVLAGLNLPMLVKLAKVREGRSLPEAIAMAQEAGRKYVTIARACLPSTAPAHAPFEKSKEFLSRDFPSAGRPPEQPYPSNRVSLTPSFAAIDSGPSSRHLRSAR
jgi:PTS system mannose-specific IIA component